MDSDPIVFDEITKAKVPGDLASDLRYPMNVAQVSN